MSAEENIRLIEFLVENKEVGLRFADIKAEVSKISGGKIVFDNDRDRKWLAA